MPDLNSLSSIALDTVRKCPALSFELLILANLDAILGHHRQRVFVQAASVTIEQNLHTLLNDLDGLLAIEVRGRLLVRHMTAHNWLGKHGTEASGETGRAVGAAEKVCGGEEGLVVVVETGNEEVVPKRVELGTTAVEELGEVIVEVGGVKTRGVGGGVRLAEREVGEVAVEILHV